MTSKLSEDRLSNWTLATGTAPGERHAYAATFQNTAQHSAPEAKP